MKKYLAVATLSIILTASLAGFVLAEDRPLEIDYPQIPGIQPPPQTSKVLLPDYVMYWVGIALIGSGFVVFGSMLWAGVQYLASAGNPSQLSDSKDRMISAFFGACLLLGSYVLLQSINPKITILRIGNVDVGEGIRVKDAAGNYLGGEAYIKTSINCVGDAEKDPAHPGQLVCKNNFDATSIEFAPGTNTQNYLDVYVYSDVNYNKDNPSGTSKKLTLSPPDTSLGGITPRSIKLAWKTPGVYLYPEIDYNGVPQIFSMNTADLGDFINKAKSVRFINYLGSDFGVILHGKKNFEGKCWPAISDSQTIGSVLEGQVGSITVFNKGATGGNGVTLYKLPDFRDDLDDPNDTIGPFTTSQFSFDHLDNNISSIEIDGKYLVALYEHGQGPMTTAHTGECELFKGSDSDLSNNRIGKCWGFTAGPICPSTCPSIPILDWCPPQFCLEPCVSSVLVIPTR